MTPLDADEARTFRREALEALEVLPNLGAFFKPDYLARHSLRATIFEGDFRDAARAVSIVCAAHRIDVLLCASLNEDTLPSFRLPAVHDSLRKVREEYHAPSYVISDERRALMIVSDSDYYWGVASTAAIVSEIEGRSRHLLQTADDIRPFVDSEHAHDRRIGAMLQTFHETCRLSRGV